MRTSLVNLWEVSHPTTDTCLAQLVFPRCAPKWRLAVTVQVAIVDLMLQIAHEPNRKLAGMQPLQRRLSMAI